MCRNILANAKTISANNYDIVAGKKGISIDQLFDNTPNDFTKIWILYWKWASLWKAYKLGI